MIFNNKQKENLKQQAYQQDIEKLIISINKIYDRFNNYSYESFSVDIDDYQSKELIEAFNALINKFLENNEGMLDDLNRSVIEVTSVDAIADLLKSVEVQNASMIAMTNNSEQLQLSIKEVSSNIQDIVAFINASSAKSNDSVKNIKHFLEFLEKSFNSMMEVNTKMNDFYDKMKSITSLVDVVKGIAEQTNLLALNASIEAARAGETGKGFAVVAGEVRKLSEDTKHSAIRIESSIKNLQGDVDSIVEKTNSTFMQLSDGKGLVEKSVQLVEGINGSMDEINNSVRQIAGNIEGQNATIEVFTEEIKDLLKEGDHLKEFCMEASKVLFDTGRNIDKARGRVARFSASLSLKQWLQQYKTDHMMYVYRMYNMILGFEELTIQNMGDYTKCKMGVWYHNAAPEDIKRLSSFKELGIHHKELHRLGVSCIEAYYSGNKEKAIDEYDQMKEPLKNIQKHLDELIKLAK